jgi:hypothetical protein
MFDLAAKWHVGTWQPRQLLDADDAVVSALAWFAMIGRPAPKFLLDPEFPARLAEADEYSATVDQDIEIRFWRAP